MLCQGESGWAHNVEARRCCGNSYWLCRGKELVVDGAVNDVADQVIAGQPFSVIDSSGGRVYVFQAHVAYIEEGVAREHPYQRRGMLRGN